MPVTLKFCEKENDIPQEFEVLELVEKEDKLIISGESGSGKTTTLKWLNYILAKNYLEGKNENVPLYIELNSYIGEERFIKKSFDAYVAMKAEGKGVSEDILETILKEKAIIILDGFDLLSPTDEFHPYDKISNFITDYNNCRFVISSRPGFFESIKSSFKVSELEKLTDGKIETFINRYVPNEELADTLKDKILSNQQLKSILSNPMMLYIAIKVAMGRKDKSDDLLPSKRSELYEAFISTLFSHQEEKGKGLHADRIQIENALTELYFKLQCRNEVSCKYSEALKFVQKSSEDIMFIKISPQIILKDCFTLGILNRNDNYVSYGIHQSFQEYFAAIKLKELFEAGFDVSEVLSHPKWKEVVRFTSEMMDSNSIDKFIELMLLKDELFLASKCVDKASNNTKEKLCALLADKMDSKYKLDKINSIESLRRIENFGISIIIEALKDENPDVQWSAARTLGNIESDTAVQSLINLLKDEESNIRETAVIVLGNLKSDKTVKPLINALKDKDPSVRLDAAWALRNTKLDIAIQPLINAFKDEDANVQIHATRALECIKSDTAVRLLIKTLNDENPHVRWYAAHALGNIKSDKAVDPLIKILKKDEESNVQEMAAEALGNIITAVDPLINILEKEEESNVRKNAVLALGKIKSDTAVDLLINILEKDEESNVRGMAAEALGNIKSDTAVDPLINILEKNEESNVRRNAAHALGKIKSDKAVDPLINILEKDEESNVRGMAAEALGNIKSDTAVDPLINILEKDEESNVRRSAVKALGNLKSDKAVDPLINTLKKDKDSNVQSMVVEVLGSIKSDTVVQSLIDALKDKNVNVRFCAARALGNIKSDTAVDPLINTLKKDKDSNVRGMVAEALGNIKSDKAVDPLINILEKDEESNVQMYVIVNVRRNVVVALKNIKSDKAVQPLINTLKDEDSEIQNSVTVALREICTVKNKDQLEDLLKSDHEFSVNTAFELLYEIEKKEKSEIIFSENQFRMGRVDDHKNCLRSEHVRPADEGLRDAYFGIFVDKLKSIQKPTTIVDYGCGEGKLLTAMTTLPETALENISYIGVDLSTKCRYMSRLVAEKYGFVEKFRSEPEYLKPKAFLKKEFLVDYVLFMHVLHEIELIYLPDIIYSLSNKVKNGGKIFILDQKELVEKERSFVLWDDEEDFEVLFKDSGFKPYVRYFTTGSGKQLSSIEIEKVEDKYFTKEDAGRNCLAVYKAKQAKLIEKRKTSGPSDEEYSEMSIQYTNISEQIAEYERTLHSEMN